MRDLAGLRARLDTALAMPLLLSASFLIARVPFVRWRAMLGTPVEPDPGDRAIWHADNLRARRLSRAVDRGAARLPGDFRCFPRAIALHWLLRLHEIDATLLIGVCPGGAPEEVDELHAWVVRRGEVLIGLEEIDYHPIYAARVG